MSEPLPTPRPDRQIAMIGTRRFEALPAAVQQLYRDVAVYLAERDWILRTGAAVGSDQVAAEETLAAGGRCHLFLPWGTYEVGWYRRLQEQYPGKVEITVYDPVLHPDWLESVQQYHPNPGALTQGPRALHARNFGILVQADAVVAAPQIGGTGGTEQGIRIARALGKPLYDLTRDEQAFQHLTRLVRPLAPLSP